MFWINLEDQMLFGLHQIAPPFSIAAISHHRRKNKETGNLDPISDYAKFCDE